MTPLLEKYYRLSDLYRENAEKNPDRTPAQAEASCRELGQKQSELLSQMSEYELLYLQNQSQGMSKMRYEPYLKNLGKQAAPVPRHDDSVATKYAQ